MYQENRYALLVALLDVGNGDLVAKRTVADIPAHHAIVGRGEEVVGPPWTLKELWMPPCPLTLRYSCVGRRTFLPLARRSGPRPKAVSPKLLVREVSPPTVGGSLLDAPPGSARFGQRSPDHPGGEDAIGGHSSTCPQSFPPSYGKSRADGVDRDELFRLKDRKGAESALVSPTKRFLPLATEVFVLPRPAPDLVSIQTKFRDEPGRKSACCESASSQ